VSRGRAHAATVAAACTLLLASDHGWPSAAVAASSEAVHPVPGGLTIRRSGSAAHARSGSYARWLGQRTFRLPAQAKQGPHLWWILRLRARLRVTRGARPSRLYLTGYTNGRASVQVKVAVPARGHAPIAWEAYGLLDGLVDGSTTGSVLHLDVRNYLQLAGVRPGTNTFGVGIEERARQRAFKDGEILPTTEILGGQPAPAKLRFGARPPAVVAEGSRLTAQFVLRNVGGRAAAAIRPSVSYDDRVLRLSAVEPRTIGSLAGGAGVPIRVTFARLRSNRSTIQVAAKASVASTARLYTLGARVDRSRGVGWNDVLPPVALVLLGVVLVWRSRRRATGAAT
jgi:hypothetical protein